MKVTGTIQKRGNYWYTNIRVSDDEKNNKQIAKSTGILIKGKTARETKANERKANMILAELIAEYQEKESLQCEQLFVVCMDEWLEAYKDSVRLITWEYYMNPYRVHIRPYFSQRKFSKLMIADVTPQHIESYIRAKRAEGLTVNTIKHHLRIFNGTFKRAIRCRWINYNPCEAAEKPKMRYQDKHRGKAYTPEQAKKLLEVIKGDPLESAVMLALYLGLRKSEVIGLRWCDVDLENNCVYIRNTVVRSPSQVIEGEQTKSDASRRTLSIPQPLREYLLQLLEHQHEMRKLCGNSYIENNHVCQWDDGRVMTPDYPTHHFAKIIKKNNLPKITFHELRHTAGSILYNAGVSAKQVQEFLGHSDVSTTLDIYTHLESAKSVETSNILGNLLSLG